MTDEDVRTKNLILFGDPGSNSVLAQIASKLPIRWTKDSVIAKGGAYSAEDHVPVLIYPNPLNPKRYVVINTGTTMSAADLEGTNALQYSRLGDYAIVKLSKQPDGAIGSVETAGFFDESWRLK